MSEYVDITNRVMDAIGDFPALEELGSEDEDMSFFARMDLTVAIVKAIAGVKEEKKYPLVQMDGNGNPLTPKTRYFYSIENGDILWRVLGNMVESIEPGKGWTNDSDIWAGPDDLLQCADVREINFTEFKKKYDANQPF